MIDKNTANNLAEQVDDIIDRIDVATASELLKKLAHLSVEERSSLGNIYNESITKLQIVDFLDLADSEAAAIVRNHLLDFFRIDVPFEQRLIARYTFQGMPEKNNQRKIIKQAILENQERLGQFTIGEWLKKFDQRYNVEEREDQDILNFFLTDRDAAALGEVEKTVLKSILHTYDTLIATELVDVFDAVTMLKNLKRIDLEADFLPTAAQSPNSYPYASSRSFNKKNESFLKDALVNSTLSEALRIYPEVGEQLITSQKIKLHSFPYPVRPSIKNWLADYTAQLGYTKHESMARSQYIFQGANSRNLSPSEKEKLAYLLKAFDENSPLTINKNNKQVVFPAPDASQHEAARPTHNAGYNEVGGATSIATQTPRTVAAGSNLPKNLSDQFRPVSTPPAEPKNINSLQFSYRQKFPYEKNPAPAFSANNPAKGAPASWPTRNTSPTSSALRSAASWHSDASGPAKSELPKISATPNPQKLLAEKPAAEKQPTKPSPWRLPGSPQNLPKNIVDLKSINRP